MSNLLKAEWYKLRKDRTFLTLLWLVAACAALYPPLLLIDGGDGRASISQFYLYDILGGNNYMMKLVPCILAGFFISSEYANGTMKSLAASGNSRLRIYWAKVIVFSVGAALIALILPVIMTGSGALVFGSQDMPELLFYVQTLGLTALYAAAFASIMAVFATIFTDSGKTIGFLLLFFLLFDSILFSISSFVTILEPVSNYSIFKLLHDIREVQSLDGSGWLALLAVPVLTYAAMGVFGSWIFQKKEIK